MQDYLGETFLSVGDSTEAQFNDPPLTSFVDPFANIDMTTQSLDNEFGVDCEIRTYEKRYNSRGEYKKLQVGQQRFLSEKSESKLKDHDHRFAMVYMRCYDKNEEICSTELHIQSPHIKKALREVVRSYPGVNLDTKEIIIKGLPKCLFHYRAELADYGSKLQDHIAIEHLEFVQNYTYRQLINQFISYCIFMEGGTNLPGLESSNLWMAFRPGELIFTVEHDSPRIMRFCSMKPSSAHSWTIEAEYLDSDGEKFGYRKRYITIDSYDGYCPLIKLLAYPLDVHPDRQLVVASLVKRGQKFVSLQGIQYRYYNGNVTSIYRQRHSYRALCEHDDDENYDVDYQRDDCLRFAKVSE